MLASGRGRRPRCRVRTQFDQQQKSACNFMAYTAPQYPASSQSLPSSSTSPSKLTSKSPLSFKSTSTSTSTSIPMSESRSIPPAPPCSPCVWSRSLGLSPPSFSVLLILCILTCIVAPPFVPVHAAVTYHDQPTIRARAHVRVDEAADHQAMEMYLQQGGYDEYRRIFNMSSGVYYNPLRFFSRSDASPSDASSTGSRLGRNHQLRISNLDLLRLTGLPIPSVDDARQLAPTVRQAIRSTSPCMQSATVVGSGSSNGKSQFLLYFSEDASAEAKQVIITDAQQWARYFSSSVPLRLCFVWQDLGGASVLGFTSTISFIEGSYYSKLKDNVLYTPALATALQGEDVLSGSNDYHVLIYLNNQVEWHYSKDSLAPLDRYDLATVVLHELTHGLFFTGVIRALDSGKAEFSQGMPSRFDQFLQVESNISVARSCNDEDHQVELYNAVRSPSLRFISRPISVGLYAPREFSRGSSIYHLNNETIATDCERASISEDECSDLMTHEMNRGYTNRNLGTTTLNIYEALISNSDGVPEGGSCDVPNYSSESPSGSGGKSADDPFNLPTWGIATVAAIGTIGALLVVAVVVSTIIARS